MLPKWHILYGFVASYILVYFFHFSLTAGLVIFFSSVLIDVDHYLKYLFETGNWSLKKSYESHRMLFTKKKFMHYFHSIGVLILIALLTYFNQLFLYILLGFIFHHILDVIDLSYRHEIHLREYFIINYILTKEKQKKYYCFRTKNLGKP